MKPIDMEKNISDMTWAIPLTRHVTLDHVKIDMDFAKIGTGDIAIWGGGGGG